MSLLSIIGTQAYDSLSNRWMEDNYMTLGTGVVRRTAVPSISKTSPGGSISSPKWTAAARAVIGMAFYASDASADAKVSLLKDGSGYAGTLHLHDGLIALHQGEYTGTLLDTAVGAYGYGAWHYLEFDYTIGDSGSWEVRVDGVTVASGTGDTKPGSITTADYFKVTDDSTTGHAFYWCDFYVDSDTLHGDCIVQTVLPSGAGASTNFIPYPNANWVNVCDLGDADESYNSSTENMALDLFQANDLPTIPGSTILGVAVNVMARKVDTANRSVYAVIRPTVQAYTKDLGVASSTYKTHQGVWETNPAGGDWTEANFNASQIGYTQQVTV